MIMCACRGRRRPATPRSRPRCVVVDPARQAEPVRHQVAKRLVLERDVHGHDGAAGLLVDSRRHAQPDRADVLADERADDVLERADHARSESVGVGTSSRDTIAPRRSMTPAAIFVPPRSTPMTRSADMGAATITAPMARGDKPYRVYRGGRVKGRVPLQRRVEPTSRRDGRRRQERPAAPPPVTTPKPRRGWGRPIGIGVLVLVLLVLAWAVASYLMARARRGDANERLGPVALDDQSGLLMTTPTTTLLLGTDHGPGAGREGAHRSDSIMLVRTDPDRGRISYLSIRATFASTCPAAASPRSTPPTSSAARTSPCARSATSPACASTTSSWSTSRTSSA
jgi:hypothetical protein